MGNRVLLYSPGVAPGHKHLNSWEVDGSSLQSASCHLRRGRLIVLASLAAFKLLELRLEGIGLRLGLLVVRSSADDVVGQQERDGHGHAHDEALRGLHEHGDVAQARDAELVRADEFGGGNGRGVLDVVRVALGGKDGRTVRVLGNGRDAVGYDGGAVALGVEEGDDVALADVGRVGLAGDDKVAGLDGRLHGTREDYKRNRAPYAGNFVLISCTFEEKNAVDDKDGDEQDAENRAEDGGCFVAFARRRRAGYASRARGRPPPGRFSWYRRRSSESPPNFCRGTT